MPMIVHADITTLLEALSASDEDGAIHATLRLLGPENAPPAKIAARVGIPAAWAGGDGHPLAVLSVSGRIAEWMRSIPIGPEPGAETRRQLAPALPLIQSFRAVAAQVAKGLPEPHPTLPGGISPADLKHAEGAFGALRDAVAARDLDRVRAILMGFYMTGTDYRAMLTAIYGALALRYPEGGHPLYFAMAGSRVLEMADWGDRVPAYIYWVSSLIVDNTPDAPAAETAHAYASAAAHDLGWLRTRLAIPKNEAAGESFRHAVASGSATEACDATLAALRGGATPMGLAAALALTAAEQLNAVPRGDADGLPRAGHALLYAHAVHVATLQTQNKEIWPLLYTAACAVNAVRPAGGAGAVEAGGRAVPSSPIGGLIAASMLRTLEQQVAAGDTATALAIAHRYLQMGHEPRALAGVIGSVAATRDIDPSDVRSLHILPMVAAAAEEYLTLPPALAAGGQNALLTAAIRLASELGGGHALADRVRAAINAEV